MVQNEAPVVLRAKRGRSPAYPGIPLEDALSKAEIIRKLEGRNEANVNTTLAHWGYKPKSGQGLVTLSALIKFGLMTDSGSGENRKARLTDLAVKILLDNRPDSAERIALIKEAALAPSIHKELWDKYQGSLPSDLNLCYYLRSEKGFQDNAADELVKEFRKTLDYAKIGESANISLEGKELPKPEDEIIKSTATLEPLQVQQKGEGQKQNPSLGSQTVKQMPIPLTNAPWGVLQIPFPMTQENWEELEDFLKLMKGPLTGIRRQGTIKEQPKQD